jgi:hypothetical protein
VTAYACHRPYTWSLPSRDNREHDDEREPSLCGTATYLGIGSSARPMPSRPLGATDDVDQDAAWADNRSVCDVDLEQQCDDEEGD